MTMQTINGIPRRCRIDLYTPAEKAIAAAVEAVEAAGAHPLLTDAVQLLSDAQNKVADFVELENCLYVAIWSGGTETRTKAHWDQETGRLDVTNLPTVKWETIEREFVESGPSRIPLCQTCHEYATIQSRCKNPNCPGAK